MNPNLQVSCLVVPPVPPSTASVVPAPLPRNSRTRCPVPSRLPWTAILISISLTPHSLLAIERFYCDESERSCAPDVLRVLFGGRDGFERWLAVRVGDEIDVTVTINTVSKVQFFSLGIAFDPDKFRIVDLGIYPDLDEIPYFWKTATPVIARVMETNQDPENVSPAPGFVSTSRVAFSRT